MMQDRTLTFRLPEDIYQKIDHLAEEKWCSVSPVVRNAIRRELYANEELFEEDYIKSTKHYMRAY